MKLREDFGGAVLAVGDACQDKKQVGKPIEIDAYGGIKTQEEPRLPAKEQRQ